MNSTGALVWLVAGTALAAAPASVKTATVSALHDAGISQSFQWGAIDQNVPIPIGNGDIGGLFDPFGGTHYDELRHGTGARRDVRTLLLTQLMSPDYWVLEDQSTYFLDPRYYHPKNPRKY